MQTGASRGSDNITVTFRRARFRPVVKKNDMAAMLRVFLFSVLFCFVLFFCRLGARARDPCPWQCMFTMGKELHGFISMHACGSLPAVMVLRLTARRAAGAPL